MRQKFVAFLPVTGPRRYVHPDSAGVTWMGFSKAVFDAEGPSENETDKFDWVRYTLIDEGDTVYFLRDNWIALEV